MRMTTFKKLLLTMLGLGVVGSLVSVGTFGFFQAQVTNPGNSFSAGTLGLTSGTGTCAAQTSFNATCGTFTLTVPTAGLEPGTTAASNASATLSIGPAGTLAPSSVKLLFSSVTGIANTLTAQCQVNGTPNTCSNLTGILNITIFDATTSTCLYGSLAGSPTVSVGSTPGAGNGACASISSLTSQRAANAFSSLPTGTAITIPPTGASWTATEPHTINIAVQFPDDTTNQNAFQGGTASFSATWTAAQ